MIDQHVLKSFFEKLADIVFDQQKDAPVTAAGAFIGRKGGAAEFQSLLKQLGSLQKTREAYQKKYPNDFVTLAFLQEKEPKKGGFLGIGGDPHFKARLSDYQERVKKPRLFFREGEPGSDAQSFLYKEVRRGLRDNELDKPWLSDKDRQVYL